jgi:Transposase
MAAISTTVRHRAHEVWAGVDTHRDLSVAVSLDERGRKLGELVVPATAAGNRELLTRARSLGTEVRGFAVEGTGGYGASLSRCLQDAGEFVIDTGRPAHRGDRQQRRARGKTDSIDAHRAARSLLAEELEIAPKSRNGNVECLCIVLVAKRGAIKARTQAVQGNAAAPHAPMPSPGRGAHRTRCGDSSPGPGRRAHPARTHRSRPWHRSRTAGCGRRESRAHAQRGQLRAHDRRGASANRELVLAGHQR